MISDKAVIKYLDDKYCTKSSVKLTKYDFICESYKGWHHVQKAGAKSITETRNVFQSREELIAYLNNLEDLVKLNTVHS